VLARIERLVEARRARDAQQDQALNRAAQAGDLPALRAALAAGADVEQRWPIIGSFDDGHTPLLIASRNGHVDLVRELIAAKADVNAIEPVFGAVPLHKATYNGHAQITELLAKADGVNLNYQGPSNGYTPLHDALWHAKADCASILLDAGARTDIVAYDGKLPVDIAKQELGRRTPS
jgi:ankyrin repeat protein